MRLAAQPSPNSTGRKHVETIVETLAAARSSGETLAEIAHDARNMVAALELYCELLGESGVLTTPYQHYGSELRLIATASRKLIEKLALLDTEKTIHARSSNSKQIPAERIQNFAMEVLTNRNLLSALAGPTILLSMDTDGGDHAVDITHEDLTRILINLVKNAAEAMPRGGQIQIRLYESPQTDTSRTLVLAIEDSGTGIPADALEKVFTSGYTTRAVNTAASNPWQVSHRGLGLSIIRSIVEAARGKICAANRSPHGARFEIVLPIAK